MSDGYVLRESRATYSAHFNPENGLLRGEKRVFLERMVRLINGIAWSDPIGFGQLVLVNFDG